MDEDTEFTSKSANLREFSFIRPADSGASAGSVKKNSRRFADSVVNLASTPIGQQIKILGWRYEIGNGANGKNLLVGSDEIIVSGQIQGYSRSPRMAICPPQPAPQTAPHYQA
jgi:hypothetical protein